jgi:hypothetical protein
MGSETAKIIAFTGSQPMPQSATQANRKRRCCHHLSCLPPRVCISEPKICLSADPNMASVRDGRLHELPASQSRNLARRHSAKSLVSGVHWPKFGWLKPYDSNTIPLGRADEHPRLPAPRKPGDAKANWWILKLTSEGSPWVPHGLSDTFHESRQTQT